MKYKNGAVYEGQWKIGKRDGKGIMKWGNYCIQHGYWDKDKPVTFNAQL